MCGRFVSSSPPDKIAEFFDASFETAPLPANFNTAPTADVYGVVARPNAAPDEPGHPRREVQAFHWGLVPSWAKDTKISAKLINARGETVADKPAFKSAFRKHRMIIPMDGFYEWQRNADTGQLTKSGKPVKQPFFIHRVDDEPLAVAGIWATWRDREATDPDGPWLHSCSVVTTEANEFMSTIHNRMPVLLPQSVWERWLDPDNDDIESLAALLVPAPEGVLTMHPVSTEVNNARHHGAHLVDEIDPTVEAGSDGTGAAQLPLG